ncbi:MAG: APC family permease [Alphaproteobacteria bacterium]
MTHASGKLRRTLTLPGAVLLGLGSILGTGAFVALGTAAGIAGPLAAPALVIAAMAAALNGLSSAQLAAAHPVSGGAYAYGTRFLSPQAGFLAGVMFLCAKTASAAAAALGLAGYLAPLLPGVPQALVAFGLVAAVTGLVMVGLRSASGVNAGLVAVTVTALLVLPASALVHPPAAFAPPAPTEGSQSITDMLRAAALLFVAFAGYGRIATLGEDVRDPGRTIPRAIVATLILSVLLYALVLWTGLHVLGADAFARSTAETAAPLSALASRLGGEALAVLVGIGAMTAMASVLLNLILGLSRVVLAMGRNGDMPNPLAGLDAKGQPTAASLAVGAGTGFLALAGGFEAVWSVSAVTVLIYYAIMNAAALRLDEPRRLYPRAVPVAGLGLCMGLAVWIDLTAWLWALALGLCAFGGRAILRAATGERPGH